MPVSSNNSDNQKNEDIERINNYTCWEGNRILCDIYEEKNGERDEIGYFYLCLRRNKPEPPKDCTLNAIEKRTYKTSECDACQYEWTGKWYKSIFLKCKKVIIDDKEVKRPITNLSKMEILAAIKKFIENGAINDFLVVKHDEELPPVDIDKSDSIDEVPF